MPPQVFISHIYEERASAAVLERYLRTAFKNQIVTFAAFDKESIGGGKKWFTNIVEHLTKSDVVLVLVSPESRRRPWINFEALGHLPDADHPAEPGSRHF